MADSRKLTIAVDVDGVCADLHSTWVAWYNAYWDDDLKVEDIRDWGMANYAKPECGSLIYDILAEPDLYLEVAPIPGALRAIEKLRGEGHRVIFVTSCVLGTSDQKIEWLRSHGFLPNLGRNPGPDFAAISDKSMVDADILIDDGIHNIEDFPGQGVLFNAHHNEDHDTPEGAARVWGWEGFLGWLYFTPGSPLYVERFDENDAVAAAQGQPTNKFWQFHEHLKRLAVQEEAEKVDRDLRDPNLMDGSYIFYGDQEPFQDPETGDFVALVNEDGGPGGESPTPILAEEERITSETGGQKGRKLARFDLLPWSTLWLVAEHFGRGACKYEDRNWERGYDWSLSYAALVRHISEWWQGEDTDEDEYFGEYHHLEAAAFHILALLTFASKDRYQHFDDRPPMNQEEFEAWVEDMREEAAA